jgi:hypothetical protein
MKSLLNNHSSFQQKHSPHFSGYVIDVFSEIIEQIAGSCGAKFGRYEIEIQVNLREEV